MYVLCDDRVDQTFLSPESLGRSTGLHSKLVEGVLADFELQGLACKKNDLTRPGHFCWNPTFAGYQALFGEERAGLLRAQTLASLELATRYLPDALAGELRGLDVNNGVILDLLRQLEKMELTSSKPALVFHESKTQRRWELTSKGARLLEQSRDKLSTASAER